MHFSTAVITCSWIFLAKCRYMCCLLKGKTGRGVYLHVRVQLRATMGGVQTQNGDILVDALSELLRTNSGVPLVLNVRHVAATVLLHVLQGALRLAICSPGARQQRARYVWTLRNVSLQPLVGADHRPERPQPLGAGSLSLPTPHIA